MHNAKYTILSLLFLCICKMDTGPFYSGREPQKAAAAHLLTHSEYPQAKNSWELHAV